MKALHFSPYETLSQDTGGKVRVFNTNNFLSKKIEIFQFSCNFFRKNGKIPFKSWVNKINKNYTEYCYSPPHFILYSFMMHKLDLFPMAHLSNLLNIYSPSWIKKKISEGYDVIQMEHPWMFNWINKHNKNNKPMVLDARNIEYVLLRDIQTDVNRSVLRDRILKKIHDMEKRCMEKVDLIFAISEEYPKEINELYGIPKEKIIPITGGFDTKNIKVPSEEEKDKLKEKLGFKGKRVVLFIGGNYFPNIKAAGFIEKISKFFKKEDNVVFLIAGTVGTRINVKSENIVVRPEPYIKPYFRLADIALNPMEIGSGSNVKVIEYLGYGLPLISTKFGLKSYLIKNEVIIKETPEEFAKAIKDILADDRKRDYFSKKGRKLAEERYDWSMIADRIIRYYKSL